MRVLSVAAVLFLLGGTAAAEKEKPKVKPWLGISINQSDSIWGGVAVLDVFDDTPASLCGLRAGDEILAVDDVEVHDTSELQSTVGAKAVGKKVKVQYVRGRDVRACRTRLAAQVSDPTELLQRKLEGRALSFSLRAHVGGATIDDASLRGSVVVLGLFSTSCDECATTLTDLATRLAAEEEGASIELLAVTADGDEAVDAYVQRTGLTVDVAVDPKNKLVGRYLAERPSLTIVVLDHEGKVEFAASGAGPDDTHLDTAAYCASRAELVKRKAE
jgi:peroxiredoxin